MRQFFRIIPLLCGIFCGCAFALPALRVVDTTPTDPEAVYFGARVEIEHCDSGDCQCYRIVGPDETDAKSGWISVDSPLARAALRKRVDDEFEVQLPAGPARYVVVAVDYDES